MTDKPPQAAGPGPSADPQRDQALRELRDELERAARAVAQHLLFGTVPLTAVKQRLDRCQQQLDELDN